MGLLDRAAAKTVPSAAPVPLGERHRSGLLQRAETLASQETSTKEKSSSSVDAMGEALIERVLRLPYSPSTPNAALSLLKAYASFRSALCLHREAESYRSYASLGLCSEDIRVPSDTVDSIVSRYAEYEPFPSMELIDGCYDPQSKLSFFILDHQKPPNDILVIENDSSQAPGFQKNILSQCKSRLACFDDIQKKQKTPPPLDVMIRDAFTAYASERKQFQCMVLEYEPNTQLFVQLQGVTSSFGVAYELAAHRAFLFFPLGIDTELVTHRLRKSLGVSVLESVVVRDVLSLIQILKPLA